MTVIHLPNLSANDSLHEMGLPVDAPFTCAQARDSGVARRTLEDLVRRRVLRRPIRGVYLAADIEDCLTSRVACLRLVMPPDCFAADETAAWLYAGSTALGPNADLAPPRAVFFRPRDGGRLRNGLCVSGERSVLPVDLVEVHGLVTTTPLRTALDLGRLRKRDQAMWALDLMLQQQAFEHAELLYSLPRFRGARGVVQLRALAPLADPGSASFGESALRLRWYDAGLPRPRTQIPIIDDGVTNAYLDLGCERIRFAAEYDGAAWHTGDDARADSLRRYRIGVRHGYVIAAFRATEVFGAQSATSKLASCYREAVATLGERRRRNPW